MLAYLAPGAAKPLDVTVFTRKSCPHCSRAKARLQEAGIPHEELTLNKEFSDSTLRAVAGTTSVPQIFVNGTRIGGADELEKWLAARKAA
jgi:glutaredoxin-like protein